MRAAFPRPRRASISIHKERDGRRCVHPEPLYTLKVLCNCNLPCLQFLDINLCIYHAGQSRLQQTPLLIKFSFIFISDERERCAHGFV